METQTRDQDVTEDAQCVQENRRNKVALIDHVQYLLKQMLGLDSRKTAEYMVHLGLDDKESLKAKLSTLPTNFSSAVWSSINVYELPVGSVITAKSLNPGKLIIQKPDNLKNVEAVCDLRTALGAKITANYIFDGYSDEKIQLLRIEATNVTVISKLPEFLKDVDPKQFGSVEVNVEQTWLSKAAKYTASKLKTDNDNRLDNPWGRLARQAKGRSKQHSVGEESQKSLPITEYKDRILQSIEENPIVIVVSDTGSGKSTQLTKFLYDYGYSKVIACTQPRRIAAKSVATRVAEELKSNVGGLVGYSVRFDDKTSRETRIKYMTDGILLRELLSDPDLIHYSVIMLDEAHERTLATDVLFALLKQLSARRPDLKIVVTSATLDASKFSSYFQGAPILTIPGRMYPVEIKYLTTPVLDYLDASLNMVKQIHQSEGSGDILVFLTGQAEIENAVQYFEEADVPNLVAIPLFSALSADLQALVFADFGSDVRKVIFATNIAETSLTISTIKYVVDPGFTKTQMYDSKLGTSVLKVVPLSKAEANQRSGRAGRTGPGICYRMYTSKTFQNEMKESVEPEIRRQNLSHTILLLKSLGVGDVLTFDFMDRPNEKDVYNSLLNLYHLGALSSSGELTDLGRKMSNVPLDPEPAKSLLTSSSLGCSSEILTILSMLACPSVYDTAKRELGKGNRKEKQRVFLQQQKNIKQAHSMLKRHEGDHFTLLHIYNKWEQSNFSRDWCKNNYIQYQIMVRVKDVRKQLSCYVPSEAANGSKFNESTNAAIIESLCAGYFKNVAKLDQQDYITLNNSLPAFIHPSSVLYKRREKMVIFESLMLSSKRYMMTLSIIDPAQLVKMVPQFFRVVSVDELMRKRKSDTLKPMLRGTRKQSNVIEFS
ncbi:DEAH-box RNA-dependent ATPase [Starmerella bacillaris]|uniref:RNA helicase n=1 Tax=Starmerella bacillaris TaxID=1247836 RepID=A0AAV5RRL4_STABA|nr:DEAH-box RNA-dependent ATPase [Starmerella bacillaris]